MHHLTPGDQADWTQGPKEGIASTSQDQADVVKSRHMEHINGLHHIMHNQQILWEEKQREIRSKSLYNSVFFQIHVKKMQII